VINYSDDLEGKLLRLEHRVIALEREVERLRPYEARYISICHAARATAVSWLDTLALDGDPDLVTDAPAVAAVVAS